MSQNRGQIDSGGNNVQKQGPGDMQMDQKKIYALTTVGAGVIAAEAILAGIINRTGPVAGYADTFPTASALLAACPMLGAGDAFEFLYINSVAQAMTATAPADGSGVLVAANVAASAVRRFMVTVLAAGNGGVFSAATVNANAGITLSDLRNAKQIQSGMSVSGAGISGGTTVASVNLNTGVVTLSANATATATITGLTFLPRVEYRGLYSATA